MSFSAQKNTISQMNNIELQRMSGIATKTQKLNRKIAHTKCQLLDTRKKTPNFRYPEKWAVMIGGGVNHRMGLFDSIMIKDNHVDFCGNMKKALEKTEHYLTRLAQPIPVIVEARNLEDVKTILKFKWVTQILLDNHSHEDLLKAIGLIDKKLPAEASGNITEKNIKDYAETGVDYISMGALTYNVKSLDLSLKAI